MSASVLGRIGWTVDRDKDGHRDYSVRHLVKTSSWADGPTTVLGAAGLPAIGATWAYGNDTDSWAFCWPNAKVQPVIDRERNLYWIVENTFSTKPLARCQDTSIENPLDEPPRLSGSFVKYTREAITDRNGDKLAYSNHQLMKGPLIEFDNNRPTVVVELNTLTLNLALIASCVDTVNDATLWGLDPRHIKLSNASWARKLYGTCTFYYTTRYEFDVSFEDWDRRIIDEGTMILAPGGDASNPQDFVQYKDCRGNNQRILLDGAGGPLADGASPYEHTIEYYPESNLLLLGIPTSL